jgi:hypothetical protein
MDDKSRLESRYIESGIKSGYFESWRHFAFRAMKI